MALIVEADANGNLLIPSSAAPGSRFTVETLGETITARPERSEAERWWRDTTPEQRIEAFRDFFSRMPKGVGLTPEMLSRDDLY